MIEVASRETHKGDGDSEMMFLLLGGGCCSYTGELCQFFVFCNLRIFHCLPSSKRRPLISQNHIFWLWEVLTNHERKAMK